MIRHIVWWTLKEQAEGATAAENAVKMKAILDTFVKLPGLSGFEVSIQFLHSCTEEVAVILQSTHVDVAAFRAYMDDPEHKTFVEFARKVITARKAIDYVV